MPKLLSSTASTARRMDAVVAVFRANGALDAPRAGRVGRALIAHDTSHAARPPGPRQPPPDSGRGPSIAEATSPCGHAPQSSRSPTRALDIRNQED
jgi:hypothetical protein